MGQSKARDDREAWAAFVDRKAAPLVFAVADEQLTVPRELEPHRHARGQLFASAAGLMTVVTDAGRWLMPPERAVWVPPNERHAVRATAAARGWSLYVAPAACARLPRQPLVLQVSPLMKEAIARIANWTPKDRALTAPEQRLAQVMLDEVAAAPRQRLHLPLPREPQLLHVALELADAPDDARTLDDWARTAAMSKRTFTRRFRAETGLSFAAWRVQLRVLVAVERLAAGDSVTRVAADLGYDSPSAFAAAFRRVLGTTPTLARATLTSRAS